MNKYQLSQLNQPKDSYKYPSRFGSHASMVNKEMTEQLNASGMVVIEDEFGSYTTEANRLDSGMADPNRYAEFRLKQNM